MRAFSPNKDQLHKELGRDVFDTICKSNNKILLESDIWEDNGRIHVHPWNSGVTSDELFNEVISILKDLLHDYPTLEYKIGRWPCVIYSKE